MAIAPGRDRVRGWLYCSSSWLIPALFTELCARFLGDAPPVAGNKLMYGAGQLKVMIVGGPNSREDYHIEEGEELFLMLRGDMQLDVIERGAKRSIVIREGEMLLLPGRVPHSPQRRAGTVGLVLERERLPAELDGLRWHVPGEEGRTVLYQEWFHCTDLGVQLKPVIDRFFASDAYASKVPPEGLDSSDKIELNSDVTVMDPVSLRGWAAAACAESGGAATMRTPTGSPEFTVEASTGGRNRWSEGVAVAGEEVFVMAMEGDVVVRMQAAGDAAKERAVTVPSGSVMLVDLPAGAGKVAIDWAEAGLGLVMTNSTVIPSAE